MVVEQIDFFQDLFFHELIQRTYLQAADIAGVFIHLDILWLCEGTHCYCLLVVCLALFFIHSFFWELCGVCPCCKTRSKI